MASILEEIDTKLFNLLDIRIRPMTRGGEADKIGVVRFFPNKFLTDKSKSVFVVDPDPDLVGSVSFLAYQDRHRGLADPYPHPYSFQLNVQHSELKSFVIILRFCPRRYRYLRYLR
jgi:hypothetical protein